MIRWTIVKNKVISDDSHLSWNYFEFLTGKHINWNARIDKDIITIKDRGHIRIYDSKFIKGEVYKHRSGLYMCAEVDNNSNALLSKIGKSNMTIKSAHNPINEYWEIA